MWIYFTWWAISSVGRATNLHFEGHRFESCIAHSLNIALGWNRTNNSGLEVRSYIHLTTRASEGQNENSFSFFPSDALESFAYKGDTNVISPFLLLSYLVISVSKSAWRLSNVFTNSLSCVRLNPVIPCPIAVWVNPLSGGVKNCHTPYPMLATTRIVASTISIIQ